MSKKVAILQSNYIPWKGYFDLINMVDEFILYDNVQFTKRDWRNRNLIKTPQGPKWLTIPVDVKGRYRQSIMDTTVSQPDWAHTHWLSIVHNYSRSQFFKQYRDLFENLYEEWERHSSSLSRINYRFLVEICEILGIETKISWSTDYDLIEGKTERLVSLCKQAGATEYISGPAAKAYIDSGLFENENIQLKFMDYSGYPEYYQLYPPFEHKVSVIDLILNEGKNASRFMLSFQ